MSGSAVPRKDPTTGTWSFVVDLPDGPDGRRRQARRRGFRTKADAQAALDEIRTSGRRGTYVAPVCQTLGEFLICDWLPAIRTTVEPSTLESYTRNLTLHVVPRIGSVGLQQVDAGLLNRLYADLLDHGRLDGKPGGLSPRTVRYIHTIIGRALREAMAWDRLVRNPASVAQPPSASHAQAPEMRTWEATTLAHFLDLVRNDRHHPPWLFLATTGCRRGEALGLRWSDLTLDKNRAVFRQTVGAIDHKIHIAPRTKSGRPRPIELDSSTVATLRSLRARQAQERLLVGPGRAFAVSLIRPHGWCRARVRRGARRRLGRRIGGACHSAPASSGWCGLDGC